MPDKRPDSDQQETPFSGVRGTPDRRLRSGVEKVHGITSSEEEALERGGQLAWRGTRRKIYRAASWVLFVLLTILAIALCGGIIWLGFHYIEAIIKGEDTGEIIENILSFIFGVVTTLAVELILWKSRKP